MYVYLESEPESRAAQGRVAFMRPALMQTLCRPRLQPKVAVEHMGSARAGKRHIGLGHQVFVLPGLKV